MFDITEIKENYSRFSDDRITRIARNESKSLRDEIVPILIEELRKRDAGEHLINWVKAETRKLSTEERQKLQEWIRSCTCGNCQQETNLRGYTYKTLIGALVFTFDTYMFLIVCERCGKKKLKNSFWTSLLLGWWSPKAFIHMPFLLVEKAKNYIRRDKLDDEIINKFIDKNIGHLTLSGNEKDWIYKTLSERHSWEEEVFMD